MITKNRQFLPATDDLVYADPQKGRKKRDPAGRRRLAVALIIAVSAAAVFTTAAALGRSIQYREARYVGARTLVEQGAYSAALTAFESLGDYRDSQAQLDCLSRYLEALALMERAGQARTDPRIYYDAAAALLEDLGDYADAGTLLEQCRTGAGQEGRTTTP